MKEIEATGRCTVEWPKYLKPMNNSREHWAARAERVKKERLEVGMMLRANRVADQLGPCVPGHRLVVTFVRISPRKVDSGDNLNSCFKSIRDEIAAYFRVNDGNENLIRFDYAAQLKGPSTVRVLFHFEAFKPVKGAIVTETQLATTPQAWRKKGMLKSSVVSFRE